LQHFNGVSYGRQETSLQNSLKVTAAIVEQVFPAENQMLRFVKQRHSHLELTRSVKEKENVGYVDWLERPTEVSRHQEVLKLKIRSQVHTPCLNISRFLCKMEYMHTVCRHLTHELFAV
jgi:hypothetical protein